MKNIKKLFTICLILFIGFSFSHVFAQNEEVNENTVKVKKIKIVDGDTIITEKVYKKEANIEVETDFDKEHFEKMKVTLMDEIETLKIYVTDSLAGEIVNMKIDIDVDFEDLLSEMDLGIDTIVHEGGKTIVIKSMVTDREHIHIDENGGKHKIIIFSGDDNDKTKDRKVIVKKHDSETVWIDDKDVEKVHRKDADKRNAKTEVFVEKLDEKKNEYGLLVHPSMDKKSIYIEFEPKGKEAELILKNEAKEIIHQERVNISKGSYSRKIDLLKMENGTYFVYLIIEGEKYVRKIIAK